MARVKIVNVDKETVVVTATTMVDGDKVELYSVDVKPNTFNEYLLTKDMDLDIKVKLEPIVEIAE